MRLNDEQCDRFFDTMDALLVYVNERFQVVRNLTFDERSPYADAQISLVAHELWDNVAIIDDFVRENPYGFSQQYLNTALAWKNALPGYFKVVRYQNGRAILMSEAGVFGVNGVTSEIADEIGPAPAYVEAVLLPFDDMIIYDGFLMAFDVPPGSKEERAIQDEFEERCRAGIAMTSGDFVERVMVWRAQNESDELDRLLEDIARESDVAHGAEVLPAGFHRGALAGLSEEERARAIKAFQTEAAGSPTVRVAIEDWFNREMLVRGPMQTELEMCLLALKKDQLKELAVELTADIPASAHKTEFAIRLADLLPRDVELMENTLVEAPAAAFDTLCRALAEGDFTFSADDIERPANICPVEPYSFVFRTRGVYTLVVPREIRRMFEGFDLDSLKRKRNRRQAALSCADAAVTYYGVATLDDVYAQYRALYADALDKDAFELLIFREVSFNDMGFCLWNHQSVPYLIHFTLSRDYVAQHMLQQARGRLVELARPVQSHTGALVSSEIETVVTSTRDAMQTAFNDLETLLENLVAAHAEMDARPLEFDPLAGDYMARIYADPSVVALRRFFDERVPDSDNDYLFADRVVGEIVSSAIEVGEIHDVYNYVHELGIDESCSDPNRLPALVSNLFTCVPSWDSNGYSAREIYEQMTGRKVFFNEKGEPMRVGRDDPCPCGSGLKYRDCCGR